MKAPKLGQLLALLFLLSACEKLGTCEIGEEADCPSGAFCYAGEGEEAGSRGICVYEHVIHGFSPAMAAHGGELLIQGKHFMANPSRSSVALNGVPAEILSISPHEIRVRVPKNMGCSGPISVTANGRVAVSVSAFTYVPTANVSTFVGSGWGSDDGRGSAALFASPIGITIDTAGNLYVTDRDNDSIRKITPQGDVSTLAGGTPGFADEVGRDARFNGPYGITIDTADNLYVTDEWNHRIRKISPEGVVSTFVGSTEGFVDATGASAQFRHPYGITADMAGNLYVADTGNHCIRKVSPEGVVSTLAGGTQGFSDGSGNGARFFSPAGIALDTTGNLYVADTENHRIRKISPEGDVSTLAGGTKGFSDGVWSAAQFQQPVGIAVDATGNLYVVDHDNNRIRKILLE